MVLAKIYEEFSPKSSQKSEDGHRGKIPFPGKANQVVIRIPDSLWASPGPSSHLPKTVTSKNVKYLPRWEMRRMHLADTRPSLWGGAWQTFWEEEPWSPMAKSLSAKTWLVSTQTKGLMTGDDSVLSNNLPSWKLRHCRGSESNCEPVHVPWFTRNQSTTKIKLHVHLADASSWDTMVKIGGLRLSMLLTPGKEYFGFEMHSIFLHSFLWAMYHEVICCSKRS